MRINLDDPNLIEHVQAIKELYDTEWFSLEELQGIYDEYLTKEKKSNG